MRQKRYTW